MSIIGGRYRHGLRPLVPRSTDERGRVATPLELLFDLTFVASFGVAGNELAHGIAVGHALTATTAFVFAMFSIVWAWISVSWFASAFDNDDWLHRVLTLVQMAGVIVLAIGLPPQFASIDGGTVLDNRTLVAGYVVIRVALLLQWVRVARGDPRLLPLARRYMLLVGSAQLGWVLVAMLPLTTWPALAIAVVLFSLEALVPALTERSGARTTAGATPWHPHHLAERFALLAIIALGETVFGTLASASEISTEQGWSFDAVVVVGAGIALSFALWWTYFLVPHAAALAARRGRMLPGGYLHIVLFGAIAASGAGLHVVGYAYDPHFEVESTTVVASIAIPVAIFMAVRYVLQAWLVSALPRDGVLQWVATALPLGAIALSAASTPIWACLLVVLVSPVSVIMWFEVAGWRSLDAQLARVDPLAAIIPPGRTPT